MAYVTGTAASFSDLLTALRNACTANGWTLSGNVLHKGTCYVETKVDAAHIGAPATGFLMVRAGNGIDGADALIDPAPFYACMGLLLATVGSTYPDWDWPVTYHLHLHGDEVHMFVNYDGGLRWQFVGFGRSPAPGCPGTGNWHTGIATSGGSATNKRLDAYAIEPDGAHTTFAVGGGYFWMRQRSNENFASAFHGAFVDATGLARWGRSDASFAGIYSEGQFSAAATQKPLCDYLPSAWNNESILLPIQILNRRLQSKTSIIGELQHARVTRNDFIDAGEVITLGPDKWKVYPFYRKETAARDGSTGADHSGTMAVAIRYDGP